MNNIQKNIVYSRAISEDEPLIRKILITLNGDESNFNLGKFFVAKLKGKVVGCIRAKIHPKGTCELSSLAVLPEYQNIGIGSELVRNFLSAEKNRPLFLLTSSDKESYYKKFGFNLTNPGQLPDEFKNEYSRIINLPFAKNIEVIAMNIEQPN